VLRARRGALHGKHNGKWTRRVPDQVRSMAGRTNMRKLCSDKAQSEPLLFRGGVGVVAMRQHRSRQRMKVVPTVMNEKPKDGSAPRETTPTPPLKRRYYIAYPNISTPYAIETKHNEWKTKNSLRLITLSLDIKSWMGSYRHGTKNTGGNGQRDGG